MKFAQNTCIFSVAFAAIASLGIAGDAEAGNGWGWSKPLNQKVGSAFYSSNLKNRRKTVSRNTTSRRYYPVRSHSQPIVTSPYYYPQVTVHSPPVTIHSAPAAPITSHPVSTGRVIPSQPPVVEQSMKTPAMLDAWLAH